MKKNKKKIDKNLNHDYINGYFHIVLSDSTDSVFEMSDEDFLSLIGVVEEHYKEFAPYGNTLYCSLPNANDEQFEHFTNSKIILQEKIDRLMDYNSKKYKLKSSAIKSSGIDKNTIDKVSYELINKIIN
jgi:hypothetical protein